MNGVVLLFIVGLAGLMATGMYWLYFVPANHHTNSITDYILALLYFFSCEVDAQNQYTSLYNKCVVSARRMNRPLGSLGSSFGYRLPHSGVVVTLEDGSTWLVHKGKSYYQHGWFIKVRFISSRCMPPFQSA